MLERFTKDQKEALDRMIEEIGPGVSSARSADKMVHVLMELGWDPDSAEQFVSAIHGTMRRYVVSDAGRAALGKFYRRCMWLGIVWAAAGALIGLSAWAAASGLPDGRQTAKGLAAAGILSIIGWTSTTAGIAYFVRGLMGKANRV
jgi:hypothetical protein